VIAWRRPARTEALAWRSRARTRAVRSSSRRRSAGLLAHPADTPAQDARISATIITALYANDLSRTFETAAAIGARLGLTPIPDPRLRELDTDAWKGTLYEDVEAQFPGVRDRWIAPVAAGHDGSPSGGVTDVKRLCPGSSEN